MATPDDVAVAEELGYKRAWLYDSPALYPDVWMILAECARRTSTFEIGPGVAVPSLRHPMVTAAAIGTLVQLAPGRVNVAIGSGFTGRLTLGQRPLAWAFVREYVLALQTLLAGETTEWEGAPIRTLHPDAFGAPRPIRVSATPTTWCSNTATLIHTGCGDENSPMTADGSRRCRRASSATFEPVNSTRFKTPAAFTVSRMPSTNHSP